MPPEGLNCSVRVRTAFNSSSNTGSNTSSRRDFFSGRAGVPVQFEFVFGRSCHGGGGQFEFEFSPSSRGG